MYNVLHILTGDDGGISAIVRDYYRYIDKEKIHFDIACITEIEGNDIAVLKEMGTEIYHLPMKSSGIKEYTQQLKNILKLKKYNAIHVHESETSYIALKIAKKIGIKCRVAHSHTTAPYTSVKGEIRRLSGIILNYHYATNVIGCGKLSGERIFGKINMKRKKAIVFSNAIDLQKYSFNSIVRSSVREELGVVNKFVVGFVGRLAYQKNPLFCLKIMKELISINNDAVLLMAGNGEYEAGIREYIEDNYLQENVRLLGKRKDAERLYQAFDAFVLPSFYEGYPLVAVEALASGLPVILSSDITPEFSFSKSVKYLKIDNARNWAEYINKIAEDYVRIEHLKELDRNIFDIRCVVKKLEKIYLS